MNKTALVAVLLFLLAAQEPPPIEPKLHAKLIDQGFGDIFQFTVMGTRKFSGDVLIEHSIIQSDGRKQLRQGTRSVAELKASSFTEGTRQLVSSGNITLEHLFKFSFPSKGRLTAAALPDGAVFKIDKPLKETVIVAVYFTESHLKQGLDKSYWEIIVEDKKLKRMTIPAKRDESLWFKISPSQIELFSDRKPPLPDRKLKPVKKLTQLKKPLTIRRIDPA